MQKMLAPLILIFLNTTFCLTSSGQNKAGGGLYYGTEFNRPGLQTNLYYTLHSFPDIELGWELMYYFPDVNRYSFVGQSYRDKSFLYTFDVNAHYIFSKEQSTHWYAIGGFNLSLLQSRNLSPDGNANKTTLHSGLNGGIGVEFPVLFTLFFMEGKYIFSDFGQFVIGGGFRVKI